MTLDNLELYKFEFSVNFAGFRQILSEFGVIPRFWKEGNNG